MLNSADRRKIIMMRSSGHSTQEIADAIDKDVDAVKTVTIGMRKPCPFCGYENIVILEDTCPATGTWYLVHCDMCHAEIGKQQPKEKAVAIWNTRAENEPEDWAVCTCHENCQKPCKGECGCLACNRRYNDFLSTL